MIYTHPDPGALAVEFGAIWQPACDASLGLARKEYLAADPKVRQFIAWHKCWFGPGCAGVKLKLSLVR